jgi:hypothetical protein
MSIEDVDDVVTVLQNNSGEYITSIVEADLKFGTAPIGDSYGMMSTTRMIPVFNNIKGFVRKFQYPRDIGVSKSSLMDLELLAA